MKQVILKLCTLLLQTFFPKEAKIVYFFLFVSWEETHNLDVAIPFKLSIFE